jgi:tRNA (mo5U34)-methyltransferase
MAFEGTIDQFPEARQGRPELLARARELAWYHTLRLDEAFTTAGIFALDEFLPNYLLPDSLAGLRCLEVGAGNGYWSFQMESRGAAHVTATDIADYSQTDFSTIVGRTPLATGPAPPGAYGEPFRVAASLLDSRVEYRLCSVYDLSPTTVGTHDLVFCASMLMHLFGPFLALQRIAEICRDAFLVTTETAPLLDGESLVMFMGHQRSYPVHFIPSPSCLVEMVRACGYERVLRGPTFMLGFRDRAANPHEIPHTTLVAQKRVAGSRLALAPPRPLDAHERRASIEIVSAPRAVAPGASFDVLVRITNGADATWHAPPGLAPELDYEARLETTRQVEWARAGSSRRFVDYLPAHLSTVARLRVVAPAHEGTMHIRPLVHQDGERLRGDTATCAVAVTDDAAMADALPGRDDRIGGRLRKATTFLERRIDRRSGWSDRYEKWRARVSRMIR